MNRDRTLGWGAALVAMMLVMASCGSSDDSDASESVRPASEDLAVDAAGDTSDDAEAIGEPSRSTGSADGDEQSLQAQGSTADTETLGRAESTTAPALPDAADDAMEDEASEDPSTGGGLFGTTRDEAAEQKLDAEGANTFQDYGVRPFVATSRDPLSTFALDVDTASYSVARQWLQSGSLPPPESVRVEEYVNSFDYDYPTPSEGLTVVADAGPSPYEADNVILRLGVQAEQVRNADRPDASLTFVVDTSGSMDRQDRLDLVKTALQRLTLELDGRDRVALVTYGDRADVILEPTSASDTETILAAIDRLEPTGSTNLEAGLNEGYDLANESFIGGGINRVILASDGVANVGLTDPDGLASMIRGDADRGIHLVTVGVGMGNFNDVVMEQLADQGDGFYAYVNDETEAERLFSDDLVSTLLTVAIDGKIQVEFDTDNVEQYRLIGFENRAVLDQDFRNDAVDAGELGAGHQVTALYELTLAPGVGGNDRLGTAQLRWEDPDEGTVRETRLELTGAVLEDRWYETDADFRLAVTVAAFAELLRDSPHTGSVTLSQVAQEADSLANGSGAVGELAELIWQADARR